jgi:hypothetical protein
VAVTWSGMTVSEVDSLVWAPAVSSAFPFTFQ